LLIYNNKTQKPNKDQKNKKTHKNFILKTAQGGRYQCNLHNNDGHYIYPIEENQDDDVPDLVDQDTASQSTAGYDSDTANNDDDDVPDLIDQSVSTAHYDSESAFSLSDEENEDIILKCAFGAQVTFVDDNNNVVTLGDDVDGEQDTYHGAELSNIAIRNSNSDMSEDEREQLVTSDVVKQVIMDDDTKLAALPLKPEGILNRTENASSAPTISNKSNVILAPKVPLSNQSKLSNEAILDWLEKQNPVLADSFAQEFCLSTNQPTRIFYTPKPVSSSSNVSKSRNSPNPAPLEITRMHRSAIEDIVEQYQELIEEGQKDLWLSALESNDTELFRELTNLRVYHRPAQTFYLQSTS
jgi:hypothetical protein